MGEKIYTTEEAMPILELKKSQVIGLFKQYNIPKKGRRYYCTESALMAIKERTNRTFKSYDLKELSKEVINA